MVAVRKTAELSEMLSNLDAMIEERENELRRLIRARDVLKDEGGATKPRRGRRTTKPPGPPSGGVD